jgi:hypothetical protein
MTESDGLPQEFEKRSIEPAAWFSVGVSVYVAANQLWKKLQPALLAVEQGPVTEEQEMMLRLRGPFAMLAGLAIENWLKGAILQGTPKAKRTIRKTHDLRVLSGLLGKKWSDDEEDLLQRLTTFIEWAGRYPVALSDEKTKAPKILKSSDYLLITKVAGDLIDIHHGKS